ncbi:MAG: chromate transporter [Alphaproteobacteria bacterium]|nr:chromate transporter [Alphaproteobacteria bacterium]MBQ7285377.1 chromate transporter [Alphaproteobacteria bacterium]
MIYLQLFFEFFKIGLFAIGGGLVTVPFLFDLSEAYDWFTVKELTDMIAIAESTPGPIGVNMATYAGFNAAGILGGIIATIGLVTPSVIVIIMICRLMNKYQCNRRVHTVLEGIRPAVMALIIFAGVELAKMALIDLSHGIVFAILFASIRFYKKSPVFYLGLSAIIGVVFKL